MNLLTLWRNTRVGSTSEKNEKILRAVITWFTRKDRQEDREELLEWLFNWSIKEPTEYQLKMTRELRKFVPALFENHEDDSTFADENDRTPLHCCISKMKYCREEPADHELVSALCDLGMSIVALDCNGRSPLGIALHISSQNRWDLVEVLIRSASINVTDRNNRGQTALHILIDEYDHRIDKYNKYPVLVMELLRKGADVNQPDRDGVTAVHLAARKLDIELLREFKMNGANFNCRTKWGDDVLIIICKKLRSIDKCKMLDLIDWLVDLPGFCVNVKNDKGFTAFHYASKNGCIEIIKRLMSAGVDVHAVANDDTNALHFAAMSTNFGVMQHLFKQNLDHRRRDKVYGFSLLHMAALSGKPRICEWLVKEKRFDVDDLGKCQLTPLHLASTRGHAKVVEKLIELGADLHRTDDQFHYSALHLALMRGRFTSIRDIRTNGIKFDEKMNKLCSFSPEEMNENRASIVNDCFEHNCIPDFFFKCTTVIALSNAGAAINAKDSHGCTPLHYAARNSVGDDIVEALMKAGAHMDVLDNKCLTPLEMSFLNGNWDRLMNLLTFGANINDIAHFIDVRFDDTIKNKICFNTIEREAIKHAFKLERAGLSVDQRFKDILDDVESGYLRRQSDFPSELIKMKQRMLTDEVSLYDVLHMSFTRRSRFANSLPPDIETEFPNYSVILKGRCNEAVNRMALFEPAREAFKWMTGMPDICIYIIFSFVSNRSLRVLIDAVM